MFARNKRMNVTFCASTDHNIAEQIREHSERVYHDFIVYVDVMTDQIDVFVQRRNERPVRVATYMSGGDE
jgi:hypothetical protein